MSSTEAKPEQEQAEAGQKETRKHIRGSSILLAGRFIGLGLNFLVNVLMVRYLTKADYGAFTFALLVASMGASLSLWSMDKAVSRFLPIYDENGEIPTLRGAILLSVLSIVGIGLALILSIFGLQGLIGERLIDDPLAVSLLLIVIFISPLDALDHWFQSMFAVFASAKAIFFRRYILGPGLKLSAVLFVMFAQANVQTLAIGYVIGGFIGVSSYVAMLFGLLRHKEVFKEWNWNTLRFPIRDIFGFATPLMYSDVVYILRNNAVVFLILFFHDAVGVAEYRAVVIFARLNEVVLQSFTFLYTPLAARLFARDEKEGINDLYWQTALWITVFSFPIFVVTFALAKPITVLFLEDRYASSSIILSILALGYYFHAALGFNNHTLRVYGVVRYIVFIDVLAAIVAISLSLLLIPPYGALGGAMSASGTLIFHNILNHIGLFLHTDIQLFSTKYLKSYAMIIVGAGSILAMQIILDPSIFIGLPIAALVSLAILRANRKLLKVADTFPELLKIKPLRMLLEG